MGDFNLPIFEANSFTSMLKDLGLHELITSKYASQQHPPPPTYKHGSKAIDGIWGSCNIRIAQGGYEDLLSGSRDHCWVWVDVWMELMLGGRHDPFTQPVTKRLSCKIPKSKENYQRILNKALQDHNL